MSPVRSLSRIQLVCSDVERIAGFYEGVLGFVRADAVAAKASGRSVGLRLGDQAIELIDVRPRGRRYPPDVSGANLLFQHFAIVVGDMVAAYAHLSTQGEWTPISTDGPQKLPSSSGGATAFKFRDPDGHPLELLSFATASVPVRWQRRSADMFLGIDHSALSVADTARSIAFYRSLGLTVTGGSVNAGPEQDRLDGMSTATVDVTTLAPSLHPTPHVELLAYRDFQRNPATADPNDIVSTRLVLTVDGPANLKTLCDRHAAALVARPKDCESHPVRAMLRDPDGHIVQLEAASSLRSD